MYKLRPYQEECVNTVLALGKGERVIIALPTASGKTICLADIVNKIVGRKIIVVPSTELREQTIEKLLNTNPKLDVGSVQASIDEVDSNIVVCTRQSLTHSKSTRIQRMLEHGEFEIVIFDEVHQGVLQIEKILKQLNKDIVVVGLTATPYNLLLPTIFKRVAYRKSILSMIAEKFLCEPKAMEVQTQTDISDVRVIGGEFNQKELEEKINNFGRNDLIVRAYKEFAKERKSTIIFSSGIEHAKSITEEFNKNGIICKSIYSDMDSSEETRFEIIDDFKNGRLPVIVNINILTTGFDSPSVDCIIMASPTKSKIKFQQCIGRGLRLCEGKKDCLIIDMCDSVRNNDLVGISNIFGFKIKSGEKIQEAYLRFKTEEKIEQKEKIEQQETKQHALSLIAKEIKLFNNHMQKAFSLGYYDWFKIDNISYAISVYSYLHYVIEKESENEFVVYKINTKKEEKYVEIIDYSYNLQESIEKVENFFIQNPTSFTYRKALWKSERTTDKQRQYFPWCRDKWQVHKLITKRDIQAIIKKFKK